MKNLQSQFVILLACLIAYQIRFETFQMTTNYIIVLLVGMLIAAVILPATGAFRLEFRWAFLRKTRRLIAGWGARGHDPRHHGSTSKSNFGLFPYLVCLLGFAGRSRFDWKPAD